MSDTQSDGEYHPETDGVVQKIDYDKFISKSTLMGYIIFDELKSNQNK